MNRCKASFARSLCSVTLLVLLPCMVLAPVASAEVTPAEIVDQIDVNVYRHNLDDLLYTHAGDNRGFGAEHDPARDNIQATFESFGLDVYLDPFLYYGVTYYNVVATLPGTVYPEEQYIIGAHYDSVDNPGADDNGSGTAGVMEIARVLSQYEFEATIIFIAFDREEQGLIGSDAYAGEHENDDIRGMISMDMIAYNSGAESVDLYGRSGSNPLKSALGDAVETYGEGLSYVIEGRFDASDHAPFEWRGFQACLIIEDWGNPYYHTQNDNVDMPNYIDYEYAKRITRSVAGWLIGAAGLIKTDVVTVLPTDYTIHRGRHRSGGLGDVYVSDDARLVVQPGITQDPSEPPVWLIFEGTVPTESPSTLGFTLEARIDTPGVTQGIALFNFVTQEFQEIDSRIASFNEDSVVEIVLDSDPSDFIDPETLEVKAQLTWMPGPLVLLYPWSVGIDQSVWKIVP